MSEVEIDVRVEGENSCEKNLHRLYTSLAVGCRVDPESNEQHERCSGLGALLPSRPGLYFGMNHDDSKARRVSANLSKDSGFSVDDVHLGRKRGRAASQPDQYLEHDAPLATREGIPDSRAHLLHPRNQVYCPRGYWHQRMHLMRSALTAGRIDILMIATASHEKKRL